MRDIGVCGRISALLWLALAMFLIGAASPASAGSQEVRIVDGAVTLHGTLLLPAERAPAVLLVAGSGPTDRDGNAHLSPQRILRNDSLKLLAEGLLARGIGSLRFDKRGIAASAAPGLNEADLRFSTYVTDLRRWLALLSGQAGVTRVVLLGHSEGALIATLAAEEGGVAGLVALAGAGETAGVTIRRQLREGGMLPDQVRAAEHVLSSLEAGRPVADVPQGLAVLFRPSVQPYMMSWLPIDPVAEIARVPVPVLVVQGTTDLQIGVADANALAGAHKGAGLALIAGMNHVLKTAPADRSANLATYVDPALPLAPGLLDAVAGFVAEVTR